MNSFKLFVFFTFFSFLLFSYGCKKEKNELIHIEPSTPIVSELKDDQQELELLYKLWCPSLMDYIYYCDPPAFRCLSEVVITPPPDGQKSTSIKSSAYQLFLNSLLKNNTKQYFSDYSTGCLKLFPYLAKEEGSQFLDYLQAAEYDVIQKQNPDEEIELFIFVPKGQGVGENILEAAQLTLQVKNQIN